MPVLAAASAVLLATCASGPEPSELCPYRGIEAARAAPSAEELKVVESSKRLMGAAYNGKAVVSGRKFTLDCIGTVCAIYYRLGIDLSKDFGKYPGNGVNRLYLSLKDRGAIHADRYPRPGDIVFWDNTYDANGDGDRTNDLRTHAGIVLSVDEDGTIRYVHANIYSGVVVETMNLLKPSLAFDASGKRINSGMAIATVPGGPKPDLALAGETFSAFGDALRVAGDYKAASKLDGLMALAASER